LAQQSLPPDVLTPNTASATANTNYLLWLNGQISSLWSGLTGVQSATANLPQDEANIRTLMNAPNEQTQITALQNQVNALQAAVSALQAAQNPTPTPTSVTLSFGSLPDGPLNGLFQGVNFGSGFWQVLGGELAPIADNMPGRGLTFPKPVTITSFTASTTNLASPMIVVSSSAGSMTITFTSINQDFTSAPGWSIPISSITISPSCSGCPAPNLRIRRIIYQ